MATFTSTQAGATYPLAHSNYAGEVLCARGYIEITATLGAADIIEMVKIPEGHTIIDGLLRCNDIDINATETLELDVGTSSDADAYLNSGVLTGDAVADSKPEAGIRVPFGGTLLDGGAPALTADTTVQITVTAAAATQAATAKVELLVYYIRTPSIA